MRPVESPTSGGVHGAAWGRCLCSCLCSRSPPARWGTTSRRVAVPRLPSGRPLSRGWSSCRPQPRLWALAAPFKSGRASRSSARAGYRDPSETWLVPRRCRISCSRLFVSRRRTAPQTRRNGFLLLSGGRTAATRPPAAFPPSPGHRTGAGASRERATGTARWADRPARRCQHSRLLQRDLLREPRALLLDRARRQVRSHAAQLRSRDQATARGTRRQPTPG
jgi:hypothetical protein